MKKLHIKVFNPELGLSLSGCGNEQKMALRGGNSQDHRRIIWFIFIKTISLHGLPRLKKVQQAVRLALIFAEGSENGFAHTSGLAVQTLGRKMWN